MRTSCPTGNFFAALRRSSASLTSASCKLRSTSSIKTRFSRTWASNGFGRTSNGCSSTRWRQAGMRGTSAFAAGRARSCAGRQSRRSEGIPARVDHRGPAHDPCDAEQRLQDALFERAAFDGAGRRKSRASFSAAAGAAGESRPCSCATDPFGGPVWIFFQRLMFIPLSWLIQYVVRFPF